MQVADPVLDRDSIVAEPPQHFRRIMPLLFVAGVAYAWYLWNGATHGARVPWDAWIFPTMLILCGVLWVFQGSRRVVMDRASLSEYRSGRLLRRYPIREITAIRQVDNAVKFIFADRGTITIPNLWPGANEIRHRLQSVNDIRTGSAPPVDDWLPLDYLTFPPRCVSCGTGDVVEHRIFAGTQRHLPGLVVVRGCEIPVPACRPCSRRRKVVGFIAACALIAGGIGLVWGAVLASERLTAVRVGTIDSRGVLLLAAFAMLFVILHLTTNQVPRWLDRRLLGVAAIRLGKDKTTVQLWFRDRQAEIEVRTRTAESRTRHMSSAAETLRATRG